MTRRARRNVAKRGSICLILILLSALGARAQVVLSPVHYELDLEVDHSEERLRGAVRIELENPSTTPVEEASLVLYRLLRVESVVGEAGEDLAFRQEVVAFEDFPKLQVNRLLVDLAEPLAPGERTEIGIDYQGHLLGYAETGMRYIQDRIDPEFTILRADALAYPKPGYPSFAVNRSAAPWSFTYAAAVTVPQGLVVANGGQLEGIERTGDRVTYRYTSLSPSWRMDFAIADYEQLTAGTIRVFHLPESEEGAVGVARAAETAIELFTGWFGPPPGPTRLTFIEIPDGWGSQADVTTVIQTSAAFRDPQRHREVYHEISHLWKVAPAERPSPRWDEGLASFLEYLVTEEVTGRPVVDDRADRLLSWLRETLPGHPEWRRVPMSEYGEAQLTDLAYSVGALFFDLLYRLVGQERFNRIIATYVDRQGNGGGTTAEFLEIVQTVSEADLSKLIDDWFLGTEWAERIERSPTIAELEAYYRAAG